MMKIEILDGEDQITLVITGMLRKADGMRLGDEIDKIARKRPKQLVLDCANVVAISLDSIPLLISALERSRIGKKNITMIGCNTVVERSLRGFDFERVGVLG